MLFRSAGFASQEIHGILVSIVDLQFVMRIETVLFVCQRLYLGMSVSRVFCDYRKNRKIVVFETLNGDSISACTRLSILGSLRMLILIVKSLSGARLVRVKSWSEHYLEWPVVVSLPSYLWMR